MAVPSPLRPGFSRGAHFQPAPSFSNFSLSLANAASLDTFPTRFPSPKRASHALAGGGSAVQSASHSGSTIPLTESPSLEADAQGLSGSKRKRATRVVSATLNAGVNNGVKRGRRASNGVAEDVTETPAHRLANAATSNGGPASSNPRATSVGHVPSVFPSVSSMASFSAASSSGGSDPAAARQGASTIPTIHTLARHESDASDAGPLGVVQVVPVNMPHGGLPHTGLGAVTLVPPTIFARMKIRRPLPFLAQGMRTRWSGTLAALRAVHRHEPTLIFIAGPLTPRQCYTYVFPEDSGKGLHECNVFDILLSPIPLDASLVEGEVWVDVPACLHEYLRPECRGGTAQYVPALTLEAAIGGSGEARLTYIMAPHCNPRVVHQVDAAGRAARQVTDVLQLCALDVAGVNTLTQAQAALLRTIATEAVGRVRDAFCGASSFPVSSSSAAALSSPDALFASPLLSQPTACTSATPSLPGTGSDPRRRVTPTAVYANEPVAASLSILADVSSRHSLSDSSFMSGERSSKKRIQPVPA